MSPSEQLLAHLDALYGFAQLVTPDAEEASRLVRDTYARAFTALPAAPFETAEAAKAWLFRLLLEERSDHGGHLPPLNERPDEAPDALAARRQAHAEVLVERLLPSALLALPTRTRLLLVLCDVEGLGYADAAEVLGLDPETTARRHEEARTDLADRLREVAGPHERPLVERVLDSTAGLQHAVTALLARELEPAPPTLRPLIPLPERPRAPAHLTERTGSHPWRRMLPLLLLATALGLAAAYYLSRHPRPFLKTNLLELAAGDADGVGATLLTQEPEAVARFVLEQAGWRLSPPTLEGYRLEGVTIRELTSGINLPALIYDGDGPRIVIYAATYHLLDQGRGKIALDADILQELEDPRHVDVHDFGAEKALVWRDRDDLFIAIASGDTEEIQQKIVR